MSQVWPLKKKKKLGQLWLHGCMIYNLSPIIYLTHRYFSPKNTFFKLICFYLYLHLQCLPGMQIYIDQALNKYLFKRCCSLRAALVGIQNIKIQCSLIAVSSLMIWKVYTRLFVYQIDQMHHEYLFLKQQVSHQLIVTFKDLPHMLITSQSSLNLFRC